MTESNGLGSDSIAEVVKAEAVKAEAVKAEAVKAEAGWKSFSFRT